MASYNWPAKGGGGGSSALTGRAGRDSISNASSTVSVTFSTVMTTVNFAIVFAVTNITDGSPIFLNGIVTARSTAGFTVTFNAPTDSANYVLEWIASANV